MISFDDSLPVFAECVRKNLGDAELRDGLFWRDSLGRLSFVTARKASKQKVERANRESHSVLGPYAGQERVIFQSLDEIGEPDLLKYESPRLSPVLLPGAELCYVRLIERTVVGVDWNYPPSIKPNSRPPIAVFWSLKGGVGRTTALAVAAVDLSRKGKHVLVVDLDLEAPGIGTLLMGQQNLPKYGTLDWFVENGIQPLSDPFFRDLVGTSLLSNNLGQIDVVPAVGSLSHRFAGNVISKLSRAYIEDIDEEGKAKSFLRQTQDLIHFLTSRHDYDAVLVDARAGLNETVPASVLGLGGDILLFGVNTPQTFEGYRFLFAHLANFPISEEADWRLRLKMIHAKAAADSANRKLFNDRSFELFAEFLYDEIEPSTEGSSLNFDLDDTAAPHVPWLILDDANYREFDPLKHPELLEETFVTRTYEDFLRGLSERLEFGALE